MVAHRDEARGRANRRQVDMTMVIVALIGAIPPLLSAFVLWFTLSTKVDAVKAVSDIAADDVKGVAAKVETVREQTDGLTKALVKTARTDALKEGIAKGAQEQKDKQIFNANRDLKEKQRIDALPFWQKKK